MGCSILKTVIWKGRWIFIVRVDGHMLKTAGSKRMADLPPYGMTARGMKIQKRF
jgi:hypothetical protein